MQWLHFTDFHVRRISGPFREALTSQVDAVKTFCLSGGAIDAVFLGGDIAYGGAEEEYRVFSDYFLTPLRAIPALKKARFFVMPGNHDICCDDALPLQWDQLRSRKATFFCEDEVGARMRKPITGAFKAYRDFTIANQLLGPDPDTTVSSLYPIDEFPADILITNTSFFSNKDDKSSDPITPIPLSSLRDRLSSARANRPVFIFGHHCPSSFRKEQVGQFASLLHEKHAVYFHGHEHNPDATFHGDSFLKTLGFGAVYATSLVSDPDPIYKNTFTFCRLTDRLEIRAFSWESKPGSWIETTDIQFNTCLSGKNSNGDKVRTANIPLLSNPSQAASRPVPVNVARMIAKPSGLIPVDAPNQEVWNKFLSLSNIKRVIQQGGAKLSYLTPEEGKSTIILNQGTKRHLLICMSAVNHVFSTKEVESFNTKLDSEDFSSLTVISFGKFSAEARDLYLKLSRNKSIEILINKDITEAAERLMSAPQLKAISELDAATKQVSILIGETEIFALVIDTIEIKPSFYIVDIDGNTLPPHHKLVAGLRGGTPQFERMSYAGEAGKYSDIVCEFDELAYLNSCYKQYNVIKYAGLASVGIRFSDQPLEELYVSATATEAASTKSPRLEDVVTDHIAKFPMSDPLKDQLKRELLESVEGEGRQASHARDFCQQFDAVLLVGDPGSGKTCFVKHEILSYSKRASKPEELFSAESWYSNHFPIMLQLSEVVSEADFETVGIFEIAFRLLARKGLSFPTEKISEFSKSGKIAWFFDGLDEVVSVERRAVVVDAINKLVSDTTKFGNRVIVTSRPAAIHVVNLLPSFHRLEIQGLSDDDIKTLGLRILRMRLAESDEGLLIHQDQQIASHESLVAELLNDCRVNPGVARLAQNPLLLTLLIMIYANSGAPSAKRHIIYEQAIQTLAAVRGRDAGHSPIAASDIRVRLGAVAVSIYSKDSGIIPTLAEVTEVIRRAMETQRPEPVTKEEAHEFIRKVAEWTGLIAIEKRDGNAPEKAVVTFMHHSFLEYFGAIGLSLDIQNVDLEKLVLLPRWHEILTLLAGIIGENADVAPVLRRFIKLNGHSKKPDIDAKLLTFAIDCALECETPSEGAQRLIAESITECVKNGPARRDPWVRSEIGLRLRKLLEVCGGGLFDVLLGKLISDAQEDIAAAGIALSGYALSAHKSTSAEVMTAIKQACERKDDSVLCAICEAASRAVSLQTEDTIKVIKYCLKKSKRTKKAALEAICEIPSLAAKLWADIVELISSEDRSIARLASVASIKAGLNAEVITLNAARKDILFKAIYLSREYSGEAEVSLPEVTLESVDKLWNSALLGDRVLALQLLPLTTASEQYIYDRLMMIVRENTSREEVVAALSSLRVSEAIQIFKQADLKIIAKCLEAKTVDVRTEAGKLLGCFGQDIGAVEALLARDLQDLDSQEFGVTVRGLANATVLPLAVSRRLCDQATYYLDPNRQLDKDRLEAVLAAMQHMAKPATKDIVRALQRHLDNFRVPPGLKGNILTCIPAIMIPSSENIRVLKDFIDKNTLEFDSDMVKVPGILAAKCKESIGNVEMSVAALSEMLPSLYSLYVKIARRDSSDKNEILITQLRKGITELTQLIVTFDEFLSQNRRAQAG